MNEAVIPLSIALSDRLHSIILYMERWSIDSIAKWWVEGDHGSCVRTVSNCPCLLKKGWLWDNRDTHNGKATRMLWPFVGPWNVKFITFKATTYCSSKAYTVHESPWTGIRHHYFVESVSFEYSRPKGLVSNTVLLFWHPIIGIPNEWMDGWTDEHCALK